jgi:hypothetical protein
MTFAKRRIKFSMLWTKPIVQWLQQGTPTTYIQQYPSGFRLYFQTWVNVPLMEWINRLQHFSLPEPHFVDLFIAHPQTWIVIPFHSYHKFNWKLTSNRKQNFTVPTGTCSHEFYWTWRLAAVLWKAHWLCYKLWGRRNIIGPLGAEQRTGWTANRVLSAHLIHWAPFSSFWYKILHRLETTDDSLYQIVPDTGHCHR